MTTLKYTSKFIHRFYNSVNETADLNACWEWQGCLNNKGYGQVRCGRKLVLSHRISYELYYRLDPGSLCVCHFCDNPACCNPSHLWLGTQLDNMRDMGNKHRTPAGENSSQHKLTEQQVRDIRVLYQAGQYTYTKISEMYPVNTGTIRAIVIRKLWKHI